jgi:hypothetical protein
MKSHFSDIDAVMKRYVEDEIRYETSKDLEDLIFFSSYTVNFDIFKKATQKLKQIVRRHHPYAKHAWEADALRVIHTYDLDVAIPSERYTYLIHALVKAQIKINESVMHHFKHLCQKAHSLEYIQSRAEAIYRLLFDESMDKTSSICSS